MKNLLINLLLAPLMFSGALLGANKRKTVGPMRIAFGDKRDCRRGINRKGTIKDSPPRWIRAAQQNCTKVTAVACACLGICVAFSPLDQESFSALFLQS